jgi:hypothetical protein
MFSVIADPKGFFALRPLPKSLFDIASPFGSGAQLFLLRFPKNSATLLPQHLAGIGIAAAQARLTFGSSSGVIEAYGMTDRSGSDAFNKQLSVKRAENVKNTLLGAMGLSGSGGSFSNGLGEQFEKEYFPESPEDSSNDAFRGVVCYLWESIATARDAALRIQIAFANPPMSNETGRATLLGPLNLGRLRSSPRSVFS